jgi:hypothetical protein
MLGKRLHTFSQFILERGDWNYANHYAQYLNKFTEDSVILDLLKDFDKQVNELEDTYWYNRESRNFNNDHYALDMKIHSYPDVQKWAAIKGYSAEEIEEDESSLESAMWDQWGRFMEETYEVNSEDYMNTYDWLTKVGVGGRSGGWLLLAMEDSHSDLERILEDKFDMYLEEVSDANAGSIQLLKQIIENPEETAELIEFGIIDEETAAKAEEIIEARDEVENWLREKLNELYQIERDLEAIKADINRFRQTALADFYVWTSDSEDY